MSENKEHQDAGKTQPVKSKKVFGVALIIIVIIIISAIALFNQPNPGDVITNSIGMILVWIPAGEFMMGSPSIEEYRNDDEVPQHRVTISKGFWMSICEVTDGQYVQFLKESNYDGSKEADSHYLEGISENPKYYPMINVSWNNAQAFCKWLSQKEGKTYRLPTESEWEYSCRAGTQTRYSFGDSDSLLGAYAWYGSNSLIIIDNTVWRNSYSRVGQKKPNAFGLYDMHGNVWEWCQDWYGEEYYSSSPVVDPRGPLFGKERVLRGGSWAHRAGSCRSAMRYRNTPDYTDNIIGFRVVCEDF